MAFTRCKKCDDGNRSEDSPIEVRCDRHNRAKGAEFEGIMTCLIDGHRWPIKLSRDHIIYTEIALPIGESANLVSSVTEYIVQDVQEAELAHFSRCYKASAVMCRRAMQLGLEQQGIPDAALGHMLQQAQGKDLLTPRTAVFAEAIKGMGDAAAHRKEDLTDREVSIMIFTTVRVLNELFSAE